MMKKTSKTLVKLICATVVPTMLVSSLYVNAAPGPLQNIPFTVASGQVQPNILFILDDSTSMDWEQLLFNGTERARIYNDFVPDRNEEFLRSCSGYNRLYFDPSVTYTPWAGVDENGDPFRDQTVGAARTDPYRTSTDRVNTLAPGDSVTLTKEVTGRIISQTISNNDAGGYNYMMPGDTGLNSTGFVGFDLVGLANLLDPQGNGGPSAGYVEWNDSDGDGEYDNNECSTDPDDFILLTDIIANADESRTPDEIQAFLTNYANWFTYYRSRSFTAKNALLSIIDESRARIGIMPLFDPNTNSGTVNNGSNPKVSGAPADGTFILGGQNGTNGGGIPIKDIDTVDKTGEELEDAQEAKDNLLEYVASSTSSLIGTPLRNSLDQAGRYFHQNLTPNSRAFRGTRLHDSGKENTINDNSPILNASNGGVCQQHFTVLFSDGFATFDGLDNTVGNTDSDGVGPFDGGTFADNPNSRFNTLADFAMFYLENDLAPGNGISESALINNAGVVDRRRPGDSGAGIPAGVINHQHMTTYTIAFGIRDSSSSSFSNRDPNPTETSFNWPTNSIADMRHAAWNGRGRFLNSVNSEELVSDIESIFSEINAQTESTNAASSVSSNFIQSNSLVFQTQFDSTDWTGNLFAYRFNSDGIVDIDNPVFNVQNILNTRLLNDNVFTGSVNGAGYTNTRNIITKNNTTGNGIEFSFTSLSTSQQEIFTDARTSLAPDTEFTGSDAAFGTALVNYLRGDSTNEESISGEASGQRLFRDRERQYLGAIVNSSPQFVGAPNEGYPDGIAGSGNPTYSSFANNPLIANRTPVVYVGANDGMLHAFNAEVNTTDTSGNPLDVVTATVNSGREVFAYVPDMLMGELPQLASPFYNFDSFVDGTPTTRDVFVDGAWRTMLVGGLRNGGRSIYALDITNPVVAFEDSVGATTASGAATTVKFEYTHPDLGFTYSRPQIIKMNNDSWVTVVGNGYNAVGDGQAKLFLIDLDTGLPLTTNGIISTNVGNNNGGECTDLLPEEVRDDPVSGDVTTPSDAAVSDCNGLSSPTLVDLNGDFVVDRIYAGDLHGNMWVFDVSSETESEWTVEKLFTATQTACSTGGRECRQPITTRPEVTTHPTRGSLSTDPNILVFFGTGQFIAEGDSSIAEDQSFYGVWDAGSGFRDLAKADLVSRETTGVLATGTSGDFVADFTTEGNEAQYITEEIPASPPATTEATPDNFGWYIDLASDGIVDSSGSTSPLSDPFDRGRVNINPIVSGSVVLFTTTIPSAEVSCVPGEIPGFLTAVDVGTGSSPGFNVFFDESGNPLGSTIALTQGAIGLGTDVTADGIQTRITNTDGSISQNRFNNSESVPLGRKAWSILR